MIGRTVSPAPLKSDRGRSILYHLFRAGERFGMDPQIILNLPWKEQVRMIAYDVLRQQEEMEHEQKMLEAQIPKKMIGAPTLPNRRKRFRRGL